MFWRGWDGVAGGQGWLLPSATSLFIDFNRLCKFKILLDFTSRGNFSLILDENYTYKLKISKDNATILNDSDLLLIAFCFFTAAPVLWFINFNKFCHWWPWKLFWMCPRNFKFCFLENVFTKICSNFSLTGATSRRISTGLYLHEKDEVELRECRYLTISDE